MEQNNERGWYAAFKAKDARFDGRFFIGVSSTGIYCRPVCRAKLPGPEHCRFYPTAAAAEQAGYRPCLLCRPELAPGISLTDATATLAHRAAILLEENCSTGQSLPELAARLGYTDRHLRRAFTNEYHVSPAQYLQTCRLLLAKNLLTDSNLSALDVAMVAGFGSLRRFNDLFRKQYRLSPTALRKASLGAREPQSDIRLTLGYRPPYRWQPLLDFLAGRAISGVECVRGGEYARSVRLLTRQNKPIFGWIRVGHLPHKNALRLALSLSLLPVLPQVLSRVRHLFDLSCDPMATAEILSSMNELRPNLFVPGTRLPGCFDSFELAVRAVLGQQITVKAASTLASRLVGAYGTSVQTDIPELTHAFPAPEDILSLDGEIANHLGPLGITSARASTIRELALYFSENGTAFDRCAAPESEIRKLTGMRGIGSWTAQYIAMRAMGWTDAFLETDVAIKKALAPRTPKEMLVLSEAWRPWRSYAVIGLWDSLRDVGCKSL